MFCAAILNIVLIDHYVVSKTKLKNMKLYNTILGNYENLNSVLLERLHDLIDLNKNTNLSAEHNFISKLPEIHQN